VATSGTIATTNVPTNTLLEHAFRRCRVAPSKQTPELVQSAQQSLYLLLLGLANNGLNLWCVETHYVGFAANQATYVAPEGTIDVLNAIYSQPTRISGTDTTDTTSITTTLDDTASVKRIGVKFASVPASGTLTITGVTPVVSSTWESGVWYWYNLDPSISGTVFSASFSVPATFDEFYLATSIYDLPLTQWNRDTWSVINNKLQQGRPSTSYYFEKLIRPQVTMWPVPNNSYDYLTMFIHRQVQDVGTMMNTLEIPSRWYEAVVFMLAHRMSLELPQVPMDRVGYLEKMAEKYLYEAEQEERDKSPIYFAPNISVYTR